MISNQLNLPQTDSSQVWTRLKEDQEKLEAPELNVK